MREQKRVANPCARLLCCAQVPSHSPSRSHSMRTMLKVSIPPEAGNQAIQDGRMPKIMETALETLRPEAAYFFPENGRRTAMLIFDLKDPSQLPGISEPFFSGLNADVQFIPVMNADDLRKGLSMLGETRKVAV